MTSSEDTLTRIGVQLNSITIAFLVLSWVFIGLRIWTRTYVRLNFGWDDCTMVLAGMIYTVYCGCILYIEARGGGTHVTSIEQLDLLAKWVVLSESTYIITVLVLKISLAIFFMRIVVEQWHRFLIYATISVSAISSLSAFFYAIFRCGPDVSHYASLQLQNKCTGRAPDRFVAYQQAAFAFLTDCIFVVLPIMLLWNANMQRRSKILVGLILTLATLGCICSAIRFQYVDGLTDVRDFFWSATNVSIWSTIEPGAGIIAGCLATLRPLLKQAFATAKSIRSTISHSQKPTPNSSQQGGDGSGTGPTRAHPDCREANIDLEGNQNDNYELRSDLSKKGESTDCILSGQSIDTWPPRRSGSGGTFERGDKRNDTKNSSDS
ncbi:hypothetical protein P280DRAFT_548514 [Massarina eburnea CBS 473.64]|uniref:Rhodopsin domain-containing protein n=1 Tax=Massarina eburnea CBS 473.64 TaxID=1395130 RepID=A0A6A6S5A3_9PLEO|nr:hypothetical protein P280DRAFT_548514 [Massarina eburnea CBS 473.64]